MKRTYVYRDGKMVEKKDPNMVDFGIPQIMDDTVEDFMLEVLKLVVKPFKTHRVIEVELEPVGFPILKDQSQQLPNPILKVQTP